MFEKIVQKILSPILSEYVEDFNAENMKIGLWSGEVVIKNVRLRKQILKKLNLPFKLKYSLLGSLRMTIPWKSLGSSKIEIMIQGLELLITQLPQNLWQCKNHKIIEKRKQELISYCDSIVQDFAKKTANADKDEQEKGFFGSMLTKILDNVQVTIKDIHVRFQDEITRKYSFGVTLEELKVFTVNKNGEPEFIDRSKKQNENQPLRKKLILSNFGIYWNQKSQFFNQPQIHSGMLLSIARTNQPPNKNMNYLILMSSNALLYQRQPGKQYVEPQINLFIEFEELKVKVTNLQLQQIVTMSERLQGFMNQVKLQNRKKLTPEEMIAYHKEFLRIFPSFFDKKTTPEDNNKIQSILEKMEVENFKDGIKNYLQGKQKEKMVQDKLKEKKGWFSFSKPKDLTEQEMKEIQNFVKDNFGTETKIIKRPEDFYYIKVNFTLKLLELSIANTKVKVKNQQGLTVSLQEIGMDLNLREGGYLLNFGIGNIKVDMYSREVGKPENTKITNILQKMPEESTTKKLGQYIKLQVVGNPLGKKHLDTELILQTEELLVEFDPRLLKVATDFADIKISSQNSEAALEAYGDIKNKVSTAASSAADSIGKTEKKKNFLSLDVNISTVNLILYFDPLKTEGDIWAVSLGQIKIFSDPQTLKKPQFKPDEPMQKYCMSVSKISMTHFQNKSSFFYSKTHNSPANLKQIVLNELGVDFEIEMFQKNSEKIPSIRAKATMHNLDLYLSSSTYGAIQKIGDCFAIPAKVEAEFKQQVEKIKANEKTQIMKESKKIGIIYQQSSKEPKKYIAVLSGGYLYLYNDKKDVQYTTYYYVRNSKTKIQKQEDILKKPISLLIENSVTKIKLGFDKEVSAEEWIKVIKTLQTETDFIIRQPVDQGEKKEQQVKKPVAVDPNNLNIEVIALIQKISVNTLLHADRKVTISIANLKAKVYLHETKTIAKVSLKAIQISDNIYTYKYKQLTNFLYSESIEGKQKLIDILFEQLGEKNPQYQQINSTISVEVGKIVVNYKPETVDNLMRFLLPSSGGDGVAESKPLTADDKKTSIDSNSSSTIHHDQHLTQQQLKKRKLQKQASLKSQAEKHSIKLSLKIQQIALALVNRKTRTLFAKVGLDHFKLHFAQSNKKMDISGGIGELWLRDYSGYPNTIITEQEEYKDFVYIVESYNRSNDMVDFDIEILAYPNQAGKTMIIKAGLHDLSASFVQQPVLRIITYLTDQLLPSLSPTGSATDQSKPKPPPVLIDTKPENPTMVLIVDLTNVLAIVKPRNGQNQYLELLIKTISVRNTSALQPYITKPANEEQKVLTEIYQIKLNDISIIEKFKTKQNKLTNDLSIDLQCQLIQNPAYYQKTYGKRFEAGMRISCKLSPFLMRINHQDYNFIMKCLFWNITYDDNAEGYLFDEVVKPVVKDQDNQTLEVPSDPMYCTVGMDRIILCITEGEVPLSVLFLGGLSLKLTLGQGMKMTFEMKNLYGTHINPSTEQNTSLEKGMFNLFGFERKLKTNQLTDIHKLIDIYSAKSIAQATESLNIKVDLEKPVIWVEFESNKFGDTYITVRVQGLKIAIQLKNLLILSKLALMDADIQPPKSTLVSLKKKKVEVAPPNSGKTVIDIAMTDFLGSLSDKTGKNYVVMQGQFLIKLKMDSAKPQPEILTLAKSLQQKQGRFLDVAAHTIELRNFSLYFCNINNLKNRRYILLPIRMLLIFCQQYAIADDLVFLETDIDGNLEKIIIECSVRDGLMINKIIQDNLQALQANSGPKKEIQNGQMSENVKEQPSKSEISSLRNQNYQIDKKAVQKTVKQVQKKIKEKTRAAVKLQPIQIRVVNDCNNNFMPVINFIIQESNLLYHANVIKSELTDAITLKLDFFNPRSASWEPIIETFKLELNYAVINNPVTGPETKIILTSTPVEELKELKINFSTQLVSTLLATVDIAKSENKKIESVENVNQIQVSPYIIENQTNKVIKIQRILNKDKNIYDLQPLFKGPVKLTDKAEELFFNYEGTNYSVSLQKFGLVSVQGLDDIHLDFRMDKLNRVLVFVNRLIVKNATFSPLYVIRYDQNNKKMQESITLPPGQAIPIEKDWFVQFSFNMKSFTVMTKGQNLTQTEYLQSETNKFKLAISEKRLIMCHSVIIVRAPLSILNCLPKNIEIQFISGGKQVSSRVITAQGSHETFANQDVFNLRFKILCEGFYWSQEFWPDMNQFGRESFLYLSDRESGGTSIKYIFEKDQIRGQYRLTLFCPAFIVSELDSDLQIYSNLERDETNKGIEKYYKLGGQSEYWRNEAQTQQKKKIDKRTLVGIQSGSKIRVCGKGCLIDFSQPILTKNIGVSQTRIVIETQVHDKTVSLFTVLGVDVSLKKMAQKADVYSRQITLRARWIFFNNSGYDFQVKEQGGERFYYEIYKGEKKPFYFIVPQLKDKPKGLIFRSRGTSESIPVLMNGLGSIYFRLQKYEEGVKVGYIYFKLNTQEIDSYLYYQLTEVSYENLPYQVVVRSFNIEAFVPLFQQQLRKGGPPVMFINENPSQPYHLQLFIRPIGSAAHQEVTVEADNLNFKTKLLLPQEAADAPTIPVVVYVIFNDSKKFIVIDQMKNDSQQIQQIPVQSINFKLQKISLSIIQNHTDQEKPFESFFFFMQNLQFIMQKTNKVTRYQAKLQFLQFDQDQPYSIPNPVIITPTKYKQFTTSDPKEKPKWIFNSFVEIDNTFVKNMFFNKIVIDVNDLVVKVGSPFIKLIMVIYKQYTDAAKAQDEYLIKTQINTWQKISPPQQGSKTFIKQICLAPFTINLSAQIRLNELDQQSMVVFGTFLNALGVVITNIEDAPIVLYGIELNDCTDTMQGIQNKLISHYKGSVLGQLYKVFGSLNIIGNPVSLFRNISTGIKDMKEKPSQGIVQGPLEFGKGLAEGTSSLIAHSVGGALNSVEKMTGAVASGLAALTFDKEFEERRERDRMKKPKHVFEGIQKGGKAVFHGFKEGLTGLVLKPYENAQKDGAVGFFKGVAQGLTGVVVKPVTGVIDFASKTTEGLKNTALYLQDKPNQYRIRYPRVLYTQTGTVREYDPVDSKLFSIIRKNKYQQKYHLSNDYFMQSYKVSDNYLVVLSTAIVLLKLEDQTIYWSIPLMQSKIARVSEDSFRMEGPPKNQQFWEKGVNESVKFENKEQADKFDKLVQDLKLNVGKF